MIYFNFSLYLPKKMKTDQIDYIEKDWKIYKNKAIEFQVSKWGHSWTLIGITFRPTFWQSHAGIFLELELFNYSMIINWYDVRHWDSKKGEWEIYDDKSTL